MPCTDSLESNAGHHGDDSLTLIDNHSHDHDNDEDDCPPFCGCQCCGVNVYAPQIFIFKKEESSINDTYKDNYSFNYTFQFLGGVWHPPSLA